MTYGITVKYFEESNGKKFHYESYREYKKLGKAAWKWVNAFNNHFTLSSFEVRDENGKPLNWEV